MIYNLQTMISGNCDLKSICKKENIIIFIIYEQGDYKFKSHLVLQINTEHESDRYRAIFIATCRYMTYASLRVRNIMIAPLLASAVSRPPQQQMPRPVRCRP